MFTFTLNTLIFMFICSFYGQLKIGYSRLFVRKTENIIGAFLFVTRTHSVVKCKLDHKYKISNFEFVAKVNYFV